MIIGIPREMSRGELRVAATPEHVAKLLKMGFKVRVETGAGDGAHFADELYKTAGAEIVSDATKLWTESDMVLKVQPPALRPDGRHEAELLREGASLVSFVWPARNPELLQKLSQKKISVLAMDAVPRISRAQKLDALSSMANIAGYRAIIEAAGHFGRFFSGQITAAGKVPPAKVLVIGAGVAGLAAIGAAKGLGAIVRAFDTRPEVKDQVRSMGAEFLELDFKEDGSGEGGYAKVMSEAFVKAEMELFAKQAKEVDIIVTTALIPGTKAPTLITEEMVRSMREGSVIVDLAAEQGGNCALTVPHEVVTRHGVTIIGYCDLPSRLPTQASQLYGNNLLNFLSDLRKGDGIALDLSDEVVRGSLVTHEGQVTWPPPKKTTVTTKAPAESVAPKAADLPALESKSKAEPKKPSAVKTASVAIFSALAILGLGRVAPAEFLSHFTVFVLSCFVGWQLIWNVTPALHTPLMSVTNAISGIIVVGATVQMTANLSEPATMLAAVAILIATINVAGGFLVTQRMLTMFRK